MAITLNEHKEHITRRTIQRFSDSSAPKLGLSAFFPSMTTTEKAISIEVQRSRKLIAADVQRGTQGNLNTFDNYSEKTYIPPFYKESFNFAALDVYNVTFGEKTNPSPSQALRLINTASEKLGILRDKINLAKEKQRSQALQTGIVTMVNGDNVDFKRKAASISVLSGTDLWDDAGSNPLTDIETGIKFIRQEGKSSSRRYNLIMGADSFSAFMDNAKVKEFGDFRHISILEIGTPIFNDVTGLNYHGRLSTKNGNVDLWTYDEFYEEANGTFVEFIDANKVILLPGDFKGQTAHAGVPAILRDNTNAEFSQWIMQQASEFNINNYIDPRVMAHWFDIYSAPLAVPYSIDRIYTIQTLA